VARIFRGYFCLKTALNLAFLVVGLLPVVKDSFAVTLVVEAAFHWT
jgi:hypothetical protein